MVLLQRNGKHSILTVYETAATNCLDYTSSLMSNGSENI